MVSIRGPAPKERRVRDVDNRKDVFNKDMKTIEADGLAHGMDLPAMGPEWPTATEIWWDMWRRSPQAQVMIESDWYALLEAAVIHARIWDPDSELKPGELASLTKELHRITSNYGLTYADRLKLRMKIQGDTDDGVGAAPVTAAGVPENVIDMYKKRLGVAS